MKLYNFARLIQKYSAEFQFLVQTEGHYESGEWVESEEIVETGTGAIIPMSESRIRDSGGVYTTQDRQLYMLHRIPEALKGAQIRYKGILYSVENEISHEDYADVYVYVLKWVSLFDKGADGYHV